VQPADRLHVQVPCPRGQPRGVGEQVEPATQLLRLLGERLDLLPLRGQPVGLLLHRGVEQQHTEHTDGEDRRQTTEEENVAHAGRDRPAHGDDDDSNSTNTLGDTPREEVGRLDESTVTSKLLVATPVLREPTFARTVILLLEHRIESGALGVVLNRPQSAPVADVVPSVADLATTPGVLFSGGPVSTSTAIALGLAVPGAEPEGWTPVSPPIVTVDLDHDPVLLATSLQALRVFAGYAGWAAGQLEGEIAEGAWYVVDALPGDPFLDDPQQLWRSVLRRQGWPLSAVAMCPLDPTMN